MKHWYEDPALWTTVEAADEPPQEAVQEVLPKQVIARPRKTSRTTAGNPPDRFKP